jgi:hypothetical protein
MHEVVSAYESMMAGGERLNERHRGNARFKARFTSWQIAEPETPDGHVLNDFGSVRVKFTVQVNQPIRNGHHGIILFNHERRVVWGSAVEPLELAPGLHNLVHTFPMLPLRPGPYSWFVSLWENRDELDSWDCTPDMIITTREYQHPLDEWNGLLNFPVNFRLNGTE